MLDSARLTAASRMPFVRWRFAEEVVSVGWGPGCLPRLMLFDTVPPGSAALRDDCPCQRCGLSPKIYFVILFDLTDSIKRQRQFSV